MAQDPAYPMYAQDFDMDTASWTVYEIGFYVRLLNYAWVNGGIPSDINEIARIVRGDVRTLQKCWLQRVAKKWVRKDTNLLVNPRQERERNNRAKYIESQSEKGKKGAEKRWHKPIAGAMPVLIPEDGSSSSSSSSVIKDLKDIASKAFEAWWLKYPHRNGEKVTKAESKKYLNGIKFSEWDDLIQATENYAKSKRVLDGYAKDPIRFLKKAFWKDYLSGVQTPTQDDEANAMNERIRKLRENKNV